MDLKQSAVCWGSHECMLGTFAAGVVLSVRCLRVNKEEEALWLISGEDNDLMQAEHCVLQEDWWYRNQHRLALTKTWFQKYELDGNVKQNCNWCTYHKMHLFLRYIPKSLNYVTVQDTWKGSRMSFLSQLGSQHYPVASAKFLLITGENKLCAKRHFF